jgi:UDP-3-O-acyl-N-acetylglucosamine deacetylase
MNSLTKQVRRKTVAAHRGRRVVVTLAPGDVIGFRFERTRTTYWTSLAACMDMAVRQEVAASLRAKKKGAARCAAGNSAARFHR